MDREHRRRMTACHPLRLWRVMAGLTQQALADKLRVSHMAVHMWEAGSRYPTHRQMERIAGLTGIKELRMRWDAWRYVMTRPDQLDVMIAEFRLEMAAA